ncbi:MAG TPA: PEP-CTERM sorting domain-containing protein, partial [Planctomycetota bacterium]|nr:PEP-CTERM sorting domain-containing protein [Planctomycetota bacterium]
VMKKSWIVLAVLLMSSGVWAAPVGPGGRIYLTRYESAADGDELQLYRIDVGTDWSVVADCGVIATVTNDATLNSNRQYCTSPEILHQRMDGGDGSVLLAGYFDNGEHLRYYRVTPDGTTSVMHPGIGADLYRTHDFEYTGGRAYTGSGGTALVIDHKGDATGYADSIIHQDGGTSYGNGFWADGNGNDVLTDGCDVYGPAGGGSNTYEGYTFGGLGHVDLEVGGPANGYDGTDNTVWGNGTGYEIKYNYFDGSRWQIRTYYNYKNPLWYQATDPILGMMFLVKNNGIAVGDVDNDGVTDVFAIATDSQGSPHNGPTIVRMADLNGSGDINDNETDLFKIWYEGPTLGTNSNRFDLELVQDATSGDWTLLVLNRDNGTLKVLGLLDNGAYAADSFRNIAFDLGTSGFALYGLEFDPDPTLVVPEPTTMLLVGTGVLGALGWMRRRRMT